MVKCSENPLPHILALWGSEPVELAVCDMEEVMKLLQGTSLQTNKLEHVFDLLTEMKSVLEIIEQPDGKYLIRNIYNGRQENE